MSGSHGPPTTLRICHCPSIHPHIAVTQRNPLPWHQAMSGFPKWSPLLGSCVSPDPLGLELGVRPGVQPRAPSQPSSHSEIPQPREEELRGTRTRSPRTYPVGSPRAGAPAGRIMPPAAAGRCIEGAQAPGGAGRGVPGTRIPWRWPSEGKGPSGRRRLASPRLPAQSGAAPGWSFHFL